MTTKNQWDKDQVEEPGQVPRCRIPQDELVDPFHIARTYDFNTIQEAFMFKDRALRGALDLKHLEYADSIAKQMKVLVSAQVLITRKD